MENKLLKTLLISACLCGLTQMPALGLDIVNESNEDLRYQVTIECRLGEVDETSQRIFKVAKAHSVTPWTPPTETWKKDFWNTMQGNNVIVTVNVVTKSKGGGQTYKQTIIWPKNKEFTDKNIWEAVKSMQIKIGGDL